MKASPGRVARPSHEDVPLLNFSQVVGLVNEPNMCSGGAATLRTVLRETPGLNRRSRILEVGSNTGFSVLELASASPCQVYGVDIEPTSVLLAKEKAAGMGLPNAHFSVGDGTQIAFDDGEFDLVFASNVTSFIPDKVSAVREYYRVLKTYGVLASVPIFYHRSPPARLVAEVEEAIGAPLTQRGRVEWEELFCAPGGELFFAEEHEYDELGDNAITDYVAAVLDQPCNADMTDELKAAAGERLAYFYRLFNENLGYARYAVLLFRKGAPTTFPVLHTSAPVRGTLERR